LDRQAKLRAAPQSRPDLADEVMRAETGDISLRRVP
jgi:hypothetical protein